MLRKSIFTISLIFNAFYLTSAFADSHVRPNKCPSAAALQAIEIQKNDLIEKQPGRWECCTAEGFPYYVDGIWKAREYVGNYDTNDKWSFSLHDVPANNSEQALQRIKTNLSTLRFANGPRFEMGRWYCSYYSSGGDAVVWYVG